MLHEQYQGSQEQKTILSFLFKSQTNMESWYTQSVQQREDSREAAIPVYQVSEDDSEPGNYT